MFAYPILAAWSKEYERLTGIGVSYQSIGSGGGAKALERKDVAFASVDVPWRPDELKDFRFFQFPILVNGVVPIVHVPGVPASQIRLDGPTLAKIYLGDLVYWNDPPIRKLNPGVPLPGTRITLTYRGDGAGVNYLLSEYLSNVAPWFKRRVGVRLQLYLASGMPARSNDEMAELVTRTDGAIGYVEYRYAREHGLASVRMINKAGKPVAATLESLQSAAAHADWAGSPDFATSLADLPGEETWPIAGASFILVRAGTDLPGTAAALRFFDWATRNGSKSAAALGYITMPPAVADLVRAGIARSDSSSGGAPPPAASCPTCPAAAPAARPQ
jgi:phosphate transport system substrate-binding protein